jgi:hypothetical protein
MDVHFDFARLAEEHFLVDPRMLWLARPRHITIAHDETQRRTLQGYFVQYGASYEGLAHLIHRTTAQVLYRRLMTGDGVERPLLHAAS